MTIAVISMIRDSWGGSEELWYSMAKDALSKGHKVIHLAFEVPKKHTKTEELESLGLIRIIRPGWIPPDASPQKRLFYLGKNYLRKKINSPVKKLFAKEPDIVIYNGTCYSISQETELISYISKVQNKTRFFILAHYNAETSRNISEREADTVRNAYSICKKVFFVSIRSLHTACRQLCTDIPNAEIIRNPVNLSSIEILNFPLPVTPVKFACVGNLVTAHKGQDLLLAALKNWHFTDWELHLYGTGYDQAYLEKLITYLGLKEKVFLHGRTDNIRSVWQENHVLVMPSHMEGMPLALVEAMLCGRVCIAADVGGVSEWITHGKTGYLIPAATIPLIIEGLNNALQNIAQWPGMGIEAHQSAMELYDPEAGATLLNRIIAE